MLKDIQRKQLLLAALVAGGISGMVVGGASRVAGRRSQRMSFPPVLRNAAHAVLVGEAYDRAAKAMQDEDMARLAQTHDELQKLHANEKATLQTLEQAIQLQRDAQGMPVRVRAILLARAEGCYREALRMTLHLDGQNPDTFNELGYLLADHGQTPDDFKAAERLTRRAMQLWDAEIAQLPTSNSLKLGRAITRDSLAWALFKEGQYDAARTEQERAVADYQAVASDAPQAADLHFHLGEIYRALRRPTDARLQYQQAVRLNPKDEASKKALTSLVSNK